MNSSWFKTICLFIPGLVISFLIYVYFPSLYRSGVLFPFEYNFLLWPILLLVHKHQRKIAAFICLNLNLYVFLIHAIEGIKIETGGEWESYTQIIFEPMWTIKRELVWIPMFGYILFMAFYASIYLHLRHRESIKN
ncbi:hypothetical protein [Streptococcus salivarius]